MVNRNKKRELRQLLVLILILILIYIPVSYHNKMFECKILHSSKFYLTTVIKPNTTRGSRTVKCRFIKNDKIIEIEADYIGNEPLQGQKYILEYVENIKYGRVHSECVVNEEIIQPLNGWEKLPKKDLQVKIDDYYEKILNFGVKRYLPSCNED